MASVGITDSGLNHEFIDCTLSNYNEDGSLKNQTTQSPSMVSTQTISDQVIASESTPNFHRLLRQGELIPYTLHHVKRARVVQTPSYAFGKHVFPSGDWETDEPGPAGCIGSFNVTFELPDGTSYDPLLTKALGEAKAGALAILLELAEAPKTIALFTQFARNLRRRREWLHDLLTRRYGRASLSEYHRIFGEMWLEYRYGWRQLMYTSEDILQAMDILSNDQKFTVVKGRGFASSSLNGNISSLGHNVPWFTSKKQLTHSEATSSLEQRAVVALQVSTERAAIDFNLLSLGWELIPYSFVIDWFVNIGDVARAVWPVPYIDMTAATSWKRSNKLRVLYTRDPIGGLSASTGNLEYSDEEYKRTPYTGEIPVVFNVNPRLGLANILDIIALAKSDMLKHGRNPYRA